VSAGRARVDLQMLDKVETAAYRSIALKLSIYSRRFNFAQASASNPRERFAMIRE
jgi:hypothetical protein